MLFSVHSRMRFDMKYKSAGEVMTSSVATMPKMVKQSLNSLSRSDPWLCCAFCEFFKEGKEHPHIEHTTLALKRFDPPANLDDKQNFVFCFAGAQRVRRPNFGGLVSGSMQMYVC